jgi:RNA recognition motif-containing protein
MEKGKSSEEKYSIFMSGIPFSANEKDIIEFIKDCGTPMFS